MKKPIAILLLLLWPCVQIAGQDPGHPRVDLRVFLFKGGRYLKKADYQYREYLAPAVRISNRGPGLLQWGEWNGAGADSAASGDVRFGRDGRSLVRFDANGRPPSSLVHIKIAAVGAVQDIRPLRGALEEPRHWDGKRPTIKADTVPANWMLLQPGDSIILDFGDHKVFSNAPYGLNPGRYELTASVAVPFELDGRGYIPSRDTARFVIDTVGPADAAAWKLFHSGLMGTQPVQLRDQYDTVMFGTQVKRKRDYEIRSVYACMDVIDAYPSSTAARYARDDLRNYFDDRLSLGSDREEGMRDPAVQSGLRATLRKMLGYGIDYWLMEGAERLDELNKADTLNLQIPARAKNR